MSLSDSDPIAAFYDAHPYPPPVDDLDTSAGRSGVAASVEHHLIWPDRDPATVESVLVAGCGTSQAARHALARPGARVVAIDVSSTSIDHTRALAARHRLTNLEVHRLPIERVAALDLTFDHVVCTGVLHHLADPAAGLRCLADVLAPQGALTLMVYAPYGRAGVYLMQDYCRRLGVEPSTADIADLVSVLREIPDGHPLRRLLHESPDFATDDALADALLNPRDRAYSVPDLLALVDAAGLRFGRWQRQAPYLPGCGSIGETPHAARIAALPRAEQYAALELFRGTMVRHTVIAYRGDDAATGRLDFTDAACRDWRPIVVPTAVVVEERLPPGAAAALLNRAHTDTDLVMFVERRELRAFRSIDGRRTVGQMGRDALPFIRRLWEHDLVVFDARAGGGREVADDDDGDADDSADAGARGGAGG